MLKLTLVREFETCFGTFGIIAFPEDRGNDFFFTLELPWRENKNGTSCIPTGTYVCLRYKSIKHPDTFIITKVPGRTGILFHVGNTITDTEGCVLVGGSRHQGGITNSRKGFARFISALSDVDSFELKITNKFEDENDKSG